MPLEIYIYSNMNEETILTLFLCRNAETILVRLWCLIGSGSPNKLEDIQEYVDDVQVESQG